MATYEASVRRAQMPEQKDLVDHPEHCSADPDRLAAAGAAVRQQVRVVRNQDEFGLYTLSEAREERPDTVVRMGWAGRERLGTTDEFMGRVDTEVTRSTLSDDQAREEGELVERLRDDGGNTGLIVLAPHGSDIEPHTDDQAERVAARLASARVSVWLCRGYGRGGASRRWHITSDDLSRQSFPALSSVYGRGFAHAVSFHGFTQDEVLVGGAAPDDFREEIADAIRRVVVGSTVCVRVAQPGDAFSGHSSANIVNRLTANGRNGVQIEQGAVARESRWQAIADAVAAVYLTRLATSPVGD